jgi:non-specific protein-tyrosine kinase
VVFVLSIIFCQLLAIYWVTQAPKVYQSDAQLFVSTPANSLDISSLATGSSFSQQRVKSYAQIINSPLTLEPVVKELHLNLSPEQLSSQITAVAPMDTVLISLAVRDSDPLRAAQIANAVASQFGTVASNLEEENLMQGSPIKVSTVREAVPNLSPISPRKKIIYGMGLLLGLIIALCISAIRQVFDTTVKSGDDVFGLATLAAIGFDQDASEKPLITDLRRYAARTESFRTLRTNLKYIIPSIPAKVIAISSALPNEGKTTTAINLSISFSQGGNTTVLIEGDMRRPKITKYLKLATPIDNGLTDLLSSSKKVTQLGLTKVLTIHPETGLAIIPAGKVPGNPSELLGSERFDELLSLLRKKFDYVIIDCPPLLPVADAAVISSKADGVVLIVHAGKTRKTELLGSRAAIEAVGANILGVVLNKIPSEALAYKYFYRYINPQAYGQMYQPNIQNEYAPSQEDLYRLEREDFFDRVAGKRFRKELMDETQKYDKG